jgi:hypothetical protein
MGEKGGGPGLAWGVVRAADRWTAEGSCEMRSEPWADGAINGGCERLTTAIAGVGFAQVCGFCLWDLQQSWAFGFAASSAQVRAHCAVTAVAIMARIAKSLPMRWNTLLVC